MRRALLIAVVLLGLGAAGLWVAARWTLGSDLVRQTIERQLSARLGQPVRVESAAASIFPHISLDLHRVTIGQPASVQAGRIQLLTGLRGLLSRRVEGAEVVVEDGQLAWPMPFSLAPRSAAAPAAPSFTVASVRRIVFRRVTVVTGLPPVTIDLDAALQGDRLTIEKVAAVSGATRLDASGAIDSLARLEGRLDVKGALAFAGYDISDLAATLGIAPGRLSLGPFAFAAFGGRYQGRLDLDLTRSTPHVQLNGDVAGVDVAALLKKSGAPDALTGRLSGHVALAGAGSDAATLLRAARGTFTATVVDGTLPRLDLVRPIVLAFGKPAGAPPAGSGSAFSSLGGAFTLASSTVASQNFALHSRDLDLAGKGSLRIDTGAVNARADAVLSRELTAQAGADLRRYALEDGRVVVPVTISGPLGQPTVFVDVLAAGRRALGNEIKRRATDLIDSLFKKKKGGG